MRCAVLFLIALSSFLVTSCSLMPEIRHDAGLKGTSGKAVCCRRDCLPYVETPHRLIHAIEAQLPDGNMALLLGVVLVDPPKQTLSCVLMTPEGFVLLDATAHQGLEEIRRGVPPFDSPAFSAGMLADISLLLFPPPGTLQDAGHLKNGASICRFSDNQGSTTDVVARGKDRWEIRQYDAAGFLRRSVQLSGRREGLFEQIELAIPGFMGYFLKMTLLEAEPLR